MFIRKNRYVHCQKSILLDECFSLAFAAMQNIIDPAILFFVLGVFSGIVRSNLEIPPAISRFLSLYLLMALGLKGGFALAQSGLTAQVFAGLAVAVAMAIIVPLVDFLLLRRIVAPFDAVAVAATYGSVSAVTLITATSHLEKSGIAYGGYIPAAMALMESPAILMAVLMASMLRSRTHPRKTMAADAPKPHAGQPTPFSLRKVLHESLTDGTQLVLLGAMLIGLMTGASGWLVMQSFVGHLFKGLLAFFLLDMGISAARNLHGLRGQSPWLIAYGLCAPLAHALLALVFCRLLGLPAGDTILLMVLAASASYIAVPAVLRYAIPEASPSLYMGLALGLTFPFNLIVGIPLYTAWIQRLGA
jgi:hypothetical protein